MSEHEGSAARVVYDHEVDEPHLGGRRRAVADWGVGEEIFDHMPRRRFRGNDSHRRDHHPRERRNRVEPAAADEPRERRFEPAAEPRQRRFEPAEEPRQRRFEPAEEPRQRRFEPAVEEPKQRRSDPAAAEPRARRSEPATDEPSLPDPAADPQPADVSPIAPIELAPDPVAERPHDGRRTVVIRGRGTEREWTPRVRPPRTVGERIGPRPDRLAAWAVALGMLLILIAILTAHG
jgi:hypothetical protein